VSALKLQYAWKDCNFSLTYEMTIDVWCVANKTRVSTLRLWLLCVFKLCHFLCYINIEGGGHVVRVSLWRFKFLCYINMDGGALKLQYA
jgi:hypothetical protein